MTQRKFEHKETGYIAKESEGCLQWELFGPDGQDRIGVINSKIVTRGNDWQKVSEPILVTEDNCNAYKGDTVYLVIPDSCIGMSEHKLEHGGILDWDYKAFKHKENASYYIENNKPRFSRVEREKELRWIKGKIEESFRIYSNPKYVEDELLATIQNLKQSK